MVLQFLKRLGSFIAIMILIHVAGAILFALSDYFLCWYFNSNCDRGGVIQRFLFYLVIYLMLSFYTGFFLIILLVFILKEKFSLSNPKLIAIGCFCASFFAIKTQGRIWSLYIHSPEKQYRYIVVVLIVMCILPYLINRFNKFL